MLPIIAIIIIVLEVVGVQMILVLIVLVVVAVTLIVVAVVVVYLTGKYVLNMVTFQGMRSEDQADVSASDTWIGRYCYH